MDTLMFIYHHKRILNIYKSVYKSQADEIN